VSRGKSVSDTSGNRCQTPLAPLIAVQRRRLRGLRARQTYSSERPGANVSALASSLAQTLKSPILLAEICSGRRFRSGTSSAVCDFSLRTMLSVPEVPFSSAQVIRGLGRLKPGAPGVALLEIALLATVASCMRSVQIGNAALKPFDSMYSIDRAQYGLTQLPKSGRVLIEGKSPHGDYDAMLHFGGNPSRTIAFRWDGRAYQWLGEQEQFEGPKTYETPEGPLREYVAISYYRAAGFGAPEGLLIEYRGPEPLRRPGPETNWSLTLSEVDPLSRKWGLR
jgi:hypothetical protein